MKKDRFQIYYWNDQLYVEWHDWSISFHFDGNIEIDVDGEYYGPSNYYKSIHLCDLMGFIELMKEWRRENIEKDIKETLIKMALQTGATGTDSPKGGRRNQLTNTMNNTNIIST